MKENFTYEPTHQQWQGYLNGTLSPGEKQLFEDYLQHNEFAREALEGYQTDPGSFEFFNQEVRAHTVIKSPAVNKSFLKFSVITVAVVSTVAITCFFTGEKEKPKVEYAQKSFTIYPELDHETFVVSDSEYRAIEALQPIEVQHQITVESKTVKEVEFTNVVLNNQTNDLPAVEEILPDKKEIPIDPIPVNPVPLVKKVQTLLYHNHKVIDYSNEYTAPIEKKKIMLTGTPANQESPDKPAPEMNDERIEKIPYNEYLKETMRYVAAQQYHTALKRFRNIHAFYPNDLNVYFYSGICYYNLGKTGSALIAFEKCRVNEIDEFKPEAEWCTALVLLEAGRNKEAIKLLKRIESENGFYSQQAKEKLKTLKQ